MVASVRAATANAMEAERRLSSPSCGSVVPSPDAPKLTGFTRMGGTDRWPHEPASPSASQPPNCHSPAPTASQPPNWYATGPRHLSNSLTSARRLATSSARKYRRASFVVEVAGGNPGGGGGVGRTRELRLSSAGAGLSAAEVGLSAAGMGLASAEVGLSAAGIGRSVEAPASVGAGARAMWRSFPPADHAALASSAAGAGVAVESSCAQRSSFWPGRRGWRMTSGSAFSLSRTRSASTASIHSKRGHAFN